MESLPQALDRVYKALSGLALSVQPGFAPEDEPSGTTVPPPGSPAADAGPWAALGQLRDQFGLTPFEADVLALLTGHALQPRFARACAAACGTTAVTFGLALAVLDDPHWSALSSAGPLRYWHLARVDPAGPLHDPVRLDPRILEYLLGIPALDERLSPLVRPLPDVGTAGVDGDAGTGDDGHPDLAGAAARWAGEPGATRPLLLIAAARAARERAFAALCLAAGLAPCVLDAADIPASPAERGQLARLWSREAALHGAGLLIRTHDAEPVPESVTAFLALLKVPVAVEACPGGGAEQLDGEPLRVGGLTRGERRAHARRALHGLAARVEPSAGWDDLVLPAAQQGTLRQIAAHVRHADLVNRRWGFAARHPRGLGLTALFAGPSGTGKTMAAEVVAADLGLDLYRIDLATVVSKYIGETEKNLRQIFSAASGTDAMLLFDEADALFGKRSEVRDSHDRYANLEVSYLLQQMEAYQGVAILTTNMPQALDQAFLRRLRFVVSFPFPDAAARARIWQGIFPAATPVGDLEYDQLAGLNVAGGVIRNIATLAAFLAAADGDGPAPAAARVEARHVLAAARTEYAKLDKPLTAAEARGLR